MKYILEFVGLEKDLTEEEISDVLDEVAYVVEDEIAYSNITLTKLEE